MICNEESKLKSVREYTGKIDHGSFDILNVYPEIIKAVSDKKLDKISEVAEDYDKHVPMRPVFEENVISGSVIYIDSYKNIITNINKKLFEEVGKNRNFEILVLSNHYRITKLNKSYQETPVGELLALFNSLNLLEIAMKDGNVSDLLNIQINSVVRIKFSH